MCNYLANVTRKRFDCNGILFVFDKLHTMHNWARGYLSEMVQTSSLIAMMFFVFDKFHTRHNWAKKGIYYLSEMVQTSSLIAIILFVFDKFHTIHNRAKKGIFTICLKWFKHPL